MDICPLLAAIDALLSALLSATIFMLPSPTAAKLTPPNRAQRARAQSLEHGSSLIHRLRRGIDMDSPSASAVHNPHGSGDLACFIVGEDRFTTLAADWTALAHEAPACSAAHTFGYAWDAWRFIAKARGGELRCVTLWRGRRLVCVWPFHVLRKRGIRVAYPLGVGAHEEQGEPLLIEDE